MKTAMDDWKSSGVAFWHWGHLRSRWVEEQPIALPNLVSLRKQTHRGRPAPRRHQRGVGAGEVDPARAPEHPASLVGPPAAGRGAGGDLRADGGRSLGLPRGVPYRSGPEAGARAAVPPHREAGPLGEHHQRGAARTGASGDPQELAAHLRGQCRASARRRSCSTRTSCRPSTIPSRAAAPSHWRRSALGWRPMPAT